MIRRDPLKLIGQLVADKYQIEKLVGEGGFAVVYRAVHTIWKQPVAIKFFNGLSSAPVEQRDSLVESFIQEGKLLTELSTKTVGIVQARDVGTFVTPDGLWMPYMVLEWLDGVPLDEVLLQERKEGLPAWTVAETFGFLRRVLPALEVAHGSGVAHRDIKPANLFVLGADARPPEVPIKVLDFGVAKMVSDNTHLKAALAKTGVGITSFTPQYSAPEQFSRSHGATGPWTDTYALALVAVELLTGAEALGGDDLVQLGFATANPAERPTPRRRGAYVSDLVEGLFAKALQVDPAARYQNAKELSLAIEHLEALSGFSAAVPTIPASARTELGPPPNVHAAVALTAGPTSTDTATASGRGRTLWLVGGALGFAALALAGTLASRSVDTAGASGTPLATVPQTSAVPQASAVPRASGEPSGVASASASATPATLGCPPGMESIPKGQFFQGSDDAEAPENQRPAHNVTLGAFCIDRYEVTAGDYKACSDVGRCKRPTVQNEWPGIKPKDAKLYGAECTFGVAGKEQYPINCVSWEMADLYCKAQNKRLPTEAEWEYATRGPDGRIYPWGDDAPTAEHLNACGSECVAWGKHNGVALEALYRGDDGHPTLAPVGKFEKGRSRFGPYDVVGNVWEWVQDWIGPYDAEPKTDPRGPAEGERRVIRGGGWNGGVTAWLHPSFRYAQVPTAQSHGIGFRCATVPNEGQGN